MGRLSASPPQSGEDMTASAWPINSLHLVLRTTQLQATACSGRSGVINECPRRSDAWSETIPIPPDFLLRTTFDALNIYRGFKIIPRLFASLSYRVTAERRTRLRQGLQALHDDLRNHGRSADSMTRPEDVQKIYGKP